MNRRQAMRLETRRAYFRQTGCCVDCEGLSYRRELTGCRVCRKAFIPENITESRREILERRVFHDARGLF